MRMVSCQITNPLIAKSYYMYLYNLLLVAFCLFIYQRIIYHGFISSFHNNVCADFMPDLCLLLHDIKSRLFNILCD